MKSNNLSAISWLLVPLFVNAFLSSPRIPIKFSSLKDSLKDSSSLKEPSLSTDNLNVYKKILDVAEDAARQAGILIKENIGARVKYSKTNYKVECYTNLTLSVSDLIL